MWQSSTRKKSSHGSIHGVELRSARDFHLKRVECRIKTTSPEGANSEDASARLLLNDISESGLAIFATRCLPLGTAVSIELPAPHTLSVVGRVGWCQQLTSQGRVISDSTQSFRIGVMFEHEKPEDRERVKAFCDALSAMYPGIDLTRAPYAA